MKASLDGAKAITTEALEWAKDKILMGAERRSAVISKETAECTAFHEGGHAIVVRQGLIGSTSRNMMCAVFPLCSPVAGPSFFPATRCVWSLPPSAS